MRRLATVLVALTLAACAGTGTDQSSTSTTAHSVATTITAVSTTRVSTTTTTLEPDHPDDGRESIGVTDRVTIIVRDSP